MDNPANIVAFLALGLIVFTIIRTRRRVHKLESRPLNSNEEIKSNYEEEHKAHEMIKNTELTREMSAKIQMQALALEKLIEDASEKIQELNSLLKAEPKQTPETPQNSGKIENPIVEEVVRLSREGKNDKDISQLLKRSEGEIRLMRSLGGLHAEQSSP